MTPLQQAHRGHDRQQPAQFGDLGDVALAVKKSLIRVQARGQEIQGHVDAPLPQRRGIRHGGQRVVVRNKKVRLPLFLKLQRGLHHAEIIAEVQLARRLYA